MLGFVFNSGLRKGYELDSDFFGATPHNSRPATKLIGEPQEELVW